MRQKLTKTEQKILDTLKNNPDAKLHIGWIDTRYYLIVNDKWETIRKTSVDLDNILPHLTKTEYESYDEYTWGE